MAVHNVVTLTRLCASSHLQDIENNFREVSMIQQWGKNSLCGGSRDGSVHKAPDIQSLGPRNPCKGWERQYVSVLWAAGIYMFSSCCCLTEMQREIQRGSIIFFRYQENASSLFEHNGFASYSQSVFSFGICCAVPKPFTLNISKKTLSQFSFFFQNIFFFILCVCFLYVWRMTHACSTHRGQKMAADPQD